MARTLLLMAVGVMTLAATRAKDLHGASAAAPPSNAYDGVSLEGIVGCRMSIRVDGGGDVAAGCVLVPHYYDSAITSWAESASALHCTTTARLDGGARDRYVCPDMTPAARFGRVAVQKVYCVGGDGGTGAASTADGGVGSLPIVRIECWGPNVVGAP